MLHHGLANATHVSKVECHNMLMITNGALDYGQSDSCADPKWLIEKAMARKGRITRWDAMIGRIGVVSHHL
jgi:hypothetical protein